MAERPIIFSAPMVRAILDGRKTMTRRPVKPQPDVVYRHSPFQVGTRLWVRETWGWLDWCVQGSYGYIPPEEPKWPPHYIHNGTPYSVLFKADYSDRTAWGMKGPPRWRSPIHMPRTASRITLEVTGVRVERVQEISEADCMAEGVREYEYEPTGDHPRMIGYVTDADGPDEYGTAAHHTPQEAFAKLWDSVNGPGAWDRNDWVWVVEFRPL